MAATTAPLTIPAATGSDTKSGPPSGTISPLSGMAGLEINNHITFPNGAGEGQPAANNNDKTAIAIPVVPQAYGPRKDWIIYERQYALQPYAQRSKRDQGIPAEDASTKEWLERTDRLLNFLQHDFEISPRFREEAHIDLLLEFIFKTPRFHFPEDLRQRAQALYEEFEEKAWGAASDPGEDPDVEDPSESSDEQPPTPTSAAPSAAVPKVKKEAAPPGVAYIHPPPAKHPIWGLKGIMHGIAPKLGGAKRTVLIDRRFMGEKRSASVSGDNGLKVGAWFPYQLSALFYGAHGARMAGISGNASYGAFSIVVAGMYKDVDDE